jgi:hypothetical protein
MWEPECLTTLWTSTACYGESCTVFYMWMMFVPQRKHIYGPPRPVTDIALFLRRLYFKGNTPLHLHGLLRGMVASVMLRSVALVRTDVLEDLSASFIRVTRIGELGTTIS